MQKTKKPFLALILALILLTACACRFSGAFLGNAENDGAASDEAAQNPSEESARINPEELLPASTQIRAALHSQASSISGRILSVVPAGSYIDIISRQGDWYEVLYDDKTGYIYQNFILADAAGGDTRPVGPIHILTDAELNQISSSYDGTPQGFGANDLIRDSQNRNQVAVNLSNTLAEFNPLVFGDSDSKTIYLTFSLGWENAPNTASILDILADTGIKAVFYITHEYAFNNPELVRHMIEEGHEIGSHGYSHPENGIPSLPLAEQMQDAIKMQHYIYDTFGYTMTKYNFSSSAWSVQSAALFTAMGYRVCFYSFNYADYDVSSPMDPADVLTLMTGALTPGCIYYLHPVSVSNVEVLPQFIQEARTQGYEFGVLP